MDQVQSLSSCHKRVFSCSGRTLTWPRWTMADSALRILKMLVHCPRSRTKEKPTNGIGSTVTSGVSHKRRFVCGKLDDHSSWFPCSWTSSFVKSSSMNSPNHFPKLYVPYRTKPTNQNILNIVQILFEYSNSNVTSPSKNFNKENSS